jgi:hypothetical protein
LTVPMRSGAIGNKDLIGNLIRLGSGMGKSVHKERKGK